MSEFSGKTILITGATGGLGEACARLLAGEGARLVLTARNAGALQTLSTALGEGHRVFPLDLSDPRNIAPVFREILSACGPLSGMVYCAGTAGTRPLSALNPDALSEVMDLNFASFVECCRLLCKKGNFKAPCSIVGISSVSSLQGNNAKTAYCASKAAMDAAVRCLAKEVCDKGIRVNTVLPGLVRTQMYEHLKETMGEEVGFQEIMRRQYLGVGAPQDVAQAVLFLLSERSASCTGTGLHLDGGRLST